MKVGAPVGARPAARCQVLEALIRNAPTIRGGRLA